MERLRAAFVTEAKPMLQRTFDFLLAIWCVDRSYEGWFWSVEQRWGIREVHLNWTALIAGRGFPKDGVLRTSKIYSMMLMDWWWWSWMVVVVVIMIGGVLLIVWGYRCLANEVDVSKWPDGGGDQFSSDWGISQLACHLAPHQLMHVCERQNANRESECSSEGAKQQKLKGQMTHFGSAKHFNLYQLFCYGGRKSFEQYICC